MFVLSSSYGNDSIALIQWASDQGIKDLIVAYCDTGWSTPWWGERVRQGEALAKSYGFDVARIQSIGMQQLVRDRKGFPGNGMQFCTSELKIFPFIEWIDKADPGRNAVVMIGKRRAESPNRSQTPEYIESSEIHGGRKVWHPLYLHTDEERNALVAKTGMKLLAHRSLECNPCVNANREDFLRLSAGEIERVNDLECEVGKPMFRPKRFNAMGIHGVIVWAKDGRKRGDIEAEEAECASLFGCGT